MGKKNKQRLADQSASQPIGFWHAMGDLFKVSKPEIEEMCAEFWVNLTSKTAHEFGQMTGSAAMLRCALSDEASSVYDDL